MVQCGGKMRFPRTGRPHQEDVLSTLDEGRAPTTVVLGLPDTQLNVFKDAGVCG